MKSNKTLIYEFIHKCTHSAAAEELGGVSTQYISERLGMQRTNISSMLNILVKEGTVEKLNGRPVLYRVKPDAVHLKGEQSCFSQLIGCDGSLKSAVQLAKAAILYPRRSLHSLILGPAGSGKSYFASLMYLFAKENMIIKENAPYVRFNCVNYSDNTGQMEKELFGTEGENILKRAEGGVLFIDNIELLPAHARNSLVRMVESNMIELNGVRKELNVIVVCAMNDTVSRSVIENYSKYFFIKITIPPLSLRAFKERFQMIQHFFTIEAERSNKTIHINPEILIGLLLYQCENNVKQLKRDIQLSCANAYAREFHIQKKEIMVLMSDFPYYVRTGFLNLKNHRAEIKEVMSEDCSYAFSKEKATLITPNLERNGRKKTMYDWIDEKVNELKERGIEEDDINFILSVDIENEFKQYSKRLGEQIVDKEQLSQLVNKRIIELVGDFLEEATGRFNKVYPVSVFYGLCLHLNSTLNKQNKSQRLSNEQIMEIIKNNGSEYGYCLKFVGALEQEFKIKLPIDEVVFLTLFLTKEPMAEETNLHPVVLIALHGEAAARSIVEVVNFMSGYPAYSYDMPMDKSTDTAYEELKKLVLKIHKGKGIFVIYDMGSFKTMFDMIASETGVEIKTLEIPLTLLALDCSRKVMIGMSVEEIYKDMLESYQGILEHKEDMSLRINSKNVVLTLCMSGEGAAVQIKKYIEKHIRPKNVEIIALAISNHQLLLEEVNKIKEKHNIICVVGSYDPQLFGIRFVSITDVFQEDCKELKAVLELYDKTELVKNKADDYFEVIFDHLSEELKLIDVEKLRILLPLVLKEFQGNSGCYLIKEQELALMIHIACCMEHLKGGYETPANRNKKEVITQNTELYRTLKQSLKKVENEFELEFDDNEIANILSIIKLSKDGKLT
ncbi:ATPase AAA [Anaerocolumna cellulosilytica]|uniref:ATPase AAA n=1 Tax=Anaerocolumna cellulosilytica TaxID=433286 RepID=A0A6S6QTI3_9FIRM|nr:PRD domain-containing protein [Anaerocolumna cellulosilytica]MBB5196672.1 transcriptional regulatory protein LevR/transcriptional regulator with AAA-type ATPase domain [Anaerocolumna cellulosilytica]BCJ93934.1 ATPase AAA [Anaerocolumna cellulosilytica]